MYKVTGETTFASVATRVYGDPKLASVLSSANPAFAEPLGLGAILHIPKLVSDVAAQVIPSVAPDDVAVVIDGKRYRWWHQVSISRSMTQMDRFRLYSPFEPSQPEHRAAFQPLSFQPVQFYIGGSPAFTGTVVSIDPQLSQERRFVEMAGYSVPGVLSDCSASAERFGRTGNEFKRLNLQQIAESLCEPFGIRVVFEGDPGPVFKLEQMEHETRVLMFLARLAKQRGFVISSTPLGELRFWQSVDSGTPVATLREGSSPMTGVSPQFMPQNYYSSVTGMEPTVAGLFGGTQYTEDNPFLKGVFRPNIALMLDIERGGLPDATRAFIGRMFANSVSYQVDVATWFDQSGNLWEPNTIVRLHSPGVMVYEPYDFVLTTVELMADSDRKTARLTLQLPGAYSGKIPERLPWVG